MRSIRADGFALFGVAVGVVDLGAAEGIGEAELNRVGMDVVARIEAVVSVMGGGAGDVPPEGVVDRGGEGEPPGEQDVAQFASKQ